MIKEIILEPNEALETKSTLVEYNSEETNTLIQDLKDTLRDVGYDKGCGLAANQIGVTKRAFVCRLDDWGMTFLNPEIVWESGKLVEMEEGCLSIPGESVNVKRPIAIKVKNHDRTGKETIRKYAGFQARVILHEYDHIEGITITTK